MFRHFQTQHNIEALTEIKWLSQIKLHNAAPRDM
jgi:hypothetical protein